MPIISPQRGRRQRPTTAPSSSWAEAAAAADAPARPQPANPSSGARADAARAPGTAPAVPAQPARSTRSASRAAALADAPVPDFISSPGLFVREQKPRPVGGFRGALYNLTGGGLNLGPSARQREEDELARRISRQLQGSYNTAVLSLKGGIGKTSTTVGVGLTLAEFRGDPPCAIDANPDSGDLVERALGEGIYQQQSPRTITDLLKNIESVDSLTALARYMHHAGRLHLIAGEQDPEVSDSLTAEEYLRIRKLISAYYSVALIDCGTGVTHNAMSGILQSADNLIIAAGYAVSGAKRARSTLHWLASHGYEDLARNADRGHHGQGRGLHPGGQGRDRGPPVRHLPPADRGSARPRRGRRRPGHPGCAPPGNPARLPGDRRRDRGRLRLGADRYRRREALIFRAAAGRPASPRRQRATWALRSPANGVVQIKVALPQCLP